MTFEKPDGVGEVVDAAITAHDRENYAMTAAVTEPKAEKARKKSAKPRAAKKAKKAAAKKQKKGPLPKSGSHSFCISGDVGVIRKFDAYVKRKKLANRSRAIFDLMEKAAK